MGKPKKQSLASRKRAKKMNATLENCFSSWDNKNQVEAHKASWDTAVPRKMQLLIQSMEQQKEGKSGPSGPRLGRQREDGPRDGPRPKRKNPDEEQRTPASTAAPTAGAAQSQKESQKEPQKGGKRGRQEGPPAAGSAPPPRATTLPIAKDKDFKKDARTAKPRFGQTNSAPPELKLTGRLAKGVRCLDQTPSRNRDTPPCRSELQRIAASASLPQRPSERVRTLRAGGKAEGWGSPRCCKDGAGTQGCTSSLCDRQGEAP